MANPSRHGLPTWQSAHMKLTAERPFAKPEAGARKLLEIVRSANIEVGQHAYTGAVLTAFLRAGGNMSEYSAGRNFAVARGWFEIDWSGSRIILKQGGRR